MVIRILWFSLIVTTAGFLPCATATTLQTITEDEQIQGAGTIFRGRAEQVTAARLTRGDGEVIVTDVRFTPLTVYKGRADGPTTLRFLGGALGDLEMKVDGMPRFVVGGEYVLFVSSEGNLACPTVGWAEGSLKVDRRANAAGTVAVSADVDGALESSVSPRSRRVLTEGSAKLPDFEGRLRKRIAELRAKP